ncbi:1018_t:CDS:2, partial [Racocetra persica]
VSSLKLSSTSVLIGSDITIKWVYNAGNVTVGNLSVVDNSTKASTLITGQLQLTALNYTWKTTNLGTFWFALNDGVSNKLSPQFDVLSPQQVQASASAASSKPTGSPGPSTNTKNAASAKTSFTSFNLLVSLVLVAA